MSETTPFHEGELRAQKLAGETAEGESNGAMIGDQLMPGALNFIRAQKMAILSSRDAQGRRWASILLGDAGFMEPSDRKTLGISVDAADNDLGDVLWENLRGDDHIGVLIIQLHNRQRLRVNGRAQFADGKLTLHVEEAYVNCPKYITRREFEVVSVPPVSAAGKRGALQGRKLGKAQIALLKATDILFLATGHSERGADASHRGGQSGLCGSGGCEHAAHSGLFREQLVQHVGKFAGGSALRDARAGFSRRPDAAADRYGQSELVGRRSGALLWRHWALRGAAHRRVAGAA